MHAYTSTDNRTPALGLLAALSVGVAILANWASQEVNLGPPWLISPPTVAATFGLLYQALDRIVWRWKPLHSIGLIDVPDIGGVYEGQLVSSYKETTLPIRICIDQTWTTIAVQLEVLSPESSTSYSITAALAKSGNNQARLTYTYRNQTRPGIADADMNDHDGTAEVTVELTTRRIRGRYFNFRGRQGTLDLSLKAEAQA